MRDKIRGIAGGLEPSKDGSRGCSCLEQPMKPWSPTSTSDCVHHGLGTAQPASTTTDLCPPSMGSPQKPQATQQGGKEEKNQTQETHQNTRKLLFSAHKMVFVCSPSQHSRHYRTGSQLLGGKPGVGAGAALQKSHGQSLPDALLMRQLTVLAWTRMLRVGGSQGAPTAAPQQPQAAQSLPQSLPFASTPRPIPHQQATMPGEKCSDPWTEQFCSRRKLQLILSVGMGAEK